MILFLHAVRAHDVPQILDEEVAIALDEFSKFEKRLAEKDKSKKEDSP